MDTIMGSLSGEREDIFQTALRLLDEIKPGIGSRIGIVQSEILQFPGSDLDFKFLRDRVASIVPLMELLPEESKEFVLKLIGCGVFGT
ncbi:MAG: hypothetical protein LBB16_03675, partial [Puniceicoccales bacterium]|nr:hypothetical protein [Puniceicoccales bacterium]